jgi:uncharacterized membrane protein YphA (DoxX/SURF4 family)
LNPRPDRREDHRYREGRHHPGRAIVIDILFRGIGSTDIALTVIRVAVGVFFMFSGYHKLFNAQRHRALVDELTALHVGAIRINQWWVPFVEFAGGAAVFIGFLTPLAALGLLVIVLVASVTSGRTRVRDYQPIDRADRIGDWLYLPEILYAFMLIMFVSAGAGPYSVDAAILRMIGT